MSNNEKTKKVYSVKVSIDSSSTKAFEQLASKSLEKRVQTEIKMISSNKINRGSRGSNETD